MKNHIIILTLFAISIWSCSDSDTIKPIDENNLLIGTWSYRQVDDEQMIFSRVNELPEEEYSVVFDYNKMFIERKNPGWCGTPPVMLHNFDGQWQKDDEYIEIVVGDWMGTVKYTWRIIELTDTQLRVEMIDNVIVSNN